MDEPPYSMADVCRILDDILTEIRTVRTLLESPPMVVTGLCDHNDPRLRPGAVTFVEESDVRMGHIGPAVR